MVEKQGKMLAEREAAPLSYKRTLSLSNRCIYSTIKAALVLGTWALIEIRTRDIDASSQRLGYRSEGVKECHVVEELISLSSTQKCP